MRKKILILAALCVQGLLPAQVIQWGAEVQGFSSEYSDPTLPGQWSARQALGKPSRYPAAGRSQCAWTPLDGNSRDIQWIELTYANPMQAAQVAVFENQGGGSIIRVQLRDLQGTLHEVYSNPSPVLTGDGQVLRVKFPLTAYQVKGVRIEMNVFALDGDHQIDAIGISDSEQDIDPQINIAPGSADSPPPQNLGNLVNSEHDELCPVISPDGRTLYFTRDSHPENLGANTQDVWYCTLDSLANVGTRARNMGAPINNIYNSSFCSITPDGQRAVVLNVYKPDGTSETGVSMATRIGDSWVLPEKINIDNFYNRNNFGEYVISASGTVLIMTIQRDQGYGSKDIHVSFLKEDGSWTEPKNIGSNVNTAASEASPFLAADMTTLYFSSAGHPGYGSNDMFMIRRLDDTWLKWSDPVNLGPVLNTPKWDAYYSLPASGNYAYFVSSREGTLGKQDIFRVELPASVRPLPVILVQGRVLDDETGLPLRAEIIYEDLSTGMQMGRALSAAGTGQFSIVLPAGHNYGFHARAEGYLPESEYMMLDNLVEYQELHRDLRLAPIKVGSVVRLNNLFFDSGKFTLRQESHTELERLVRMLKDYPTMTILITGHTDDIGNEASNQILSQNRAKAVFDYLTKNGIAASRLKSEGKGQTIPELPNTSAENRQRNRRVEFRIQSL